MIADNPMRLIEDFAIVYDDVDERERAMLRQQIEECFREITTKQPTSKEFVDAGNRQQA